MKKVLLAMVVVVLGLSANAWAQLHGMGRVQGSVVDEGGVLHLGPQPGDAGLDLDDVVGAAESRDDLFCLVGHGGPLL